MVSKAFNDNAKHIVEIHLMHQKKKKIYGQNLILLMLIDSQTKLTKAICCSEMRIQIYLIFNYRTVAYKYCNLNHTIIRMNNRFVQIFAVNGFKANGICIILNCIQIYTISLRFSNVRKCVCLMVLGFKSLSISFDPSRNITGSVRIYHCICLKIVGEDGDIQI